MMLELPVSGPWSPEELQLLYEVTSYWTIGSFNSPTGNQSVIEWASAVKEMNENSKKYFISNRKYTIRNCCDQFVSNWVDDFQKVRTLRPRWTTEEKDLMQEAVITCPRRRCLVPNSYKLVPDIEGIKLFMNREGFHRDIRRRYYSTKGMEAAFRKGSWNSTTIQTQAIEPLAEFEKVKIAGPQPTNSCEKNSSDEGISTGEAVAQEEDQLQL